MLLPTVWVRKNKNALPTIVPQVIYLRRSADPCLEFVFARLLLLEESVREHDVEQARLRTLSQNGYETNLEKTYIFFKHTSNTPVLPGR